MKIELNEGLVAGLKYNAQHKYFIVLRQVK